MQEARAELADHGETEPENAQAPNGDWERENIPDHRVIQGDYEDECFSEGGEEEQDAASEGDDAELEPDEVPPPGATEAVPADASVECRGKDVAEHASVEGRGKDVAEDAFLEGRGKDIAEHAFLEGRGKDVAEHASVEGRGKDVAETCGEEAKASALPRVNTDISYVSSANTVEQQELEALLLQISELELAHQKQFLRYIVRIGWLYGIYGYSGSVCMCSGYPSWELAKAVRMTRKVLEE